MKFKEILLLDNKMTRNFFWIIVIAMHLICFGKQLFFQTSNLKDSEEYLFAAENILQSNTLYAWDVNEVFNPNWLTKRPILYPLILALFKKISFGNYSLFLFLILLIQNIISVLIIKAIEKIARKITGTFNYKLALIFLLFTPAQALYANLIMSEIWLELILLLIVSCLLFEKIGIKKIGYLAFLSIAAMALKPIMIFGAFCLPIYTLYNSKFKLNIFILSILPLLYFLSISFHNKYRTGYFQYSSISTINILQYNTYTLLIHKYGTYKADSIIDNLQINANNIPVYALKQQFLNKACRTILINNWETYSYLHLRGILFCLLDPGRFDITQFFNLSHKKNLLYEINKKDNWLSVFRSFINPLGLFLFAIFIVNCIKLYCGFRFLFSKSMLLNRKLMLLLIPCYILIFTGPIGSSRFALPFFPIYLIIILITLNSKKMKYHS